MRRWIVVKVYLIKDFTNWCLQRKVTESYSNLIEYMLEKRFIRGKQWNKFIAEIPESWIEENSPIFNCRYREPLREGFYPPDMLVGKSDKE